MHIYACTIVQLTKVFVNDMFPKFVLNKAQAGQDKSEGSEM